MQKIALIDPALYDWQRSSPNTGDQIISRATRRELKRIYNNSCDIVSIPSHSILDKKAYKIIDTSDRVVVGGSNLFWFRLFPRASWPLRLIDTIKLRNVRFMGVGWGSYGISTGVFGRFVSQRIFDPEGYNSLRDRYSLDKAIELGVPNPIFTGCQTCWNFSYNESTFIRTRKKQCIFTLTDYARKPEEDLKVIKILIRFYGIKNLFFWPQGLGDRRYIENFDVISRSKILDGNLESFEKFLKNNDVDYVGTRLHGGIFALEQGKRSIILSVDNRATEMAKDLGLVVVSREKPNSLTDLLEKDTIYNLTIPRENIDIWSKELRQ